MKIHIFYRLILLLIVALFGERASAQTLAFLDVKQSNVVVHANAVYGRMEPAPSPPEYTNVLSNNNLFSDADRELLKSIPLKYKEVTTNSGPAGSVFVSSTNLINRKIRGSNKEVTVAYFRYPDTGATETIIFKPMMSVTFRTKSGDGYDVDLDHSTRAVMTFQQIKADRVDGLFVVFYEENCSQFLRFKNDRAIGHWFMWGDEGKLFLHVEFKEPYDLITRAPHYRMQKLPWREIGM